jgi:hypothetical protein
VRQAKTQELKEVNDEITTIVSNINKHIESLSEYYEFMDFLDHIAPKEFQDDKKKKIVMKRARRESREARSLPGIDGSKKDDLTDVEVHIPNKLKDIIDDSDDDFDNYFKEPHELL